MKRKYIIGQSGNSYGFNAYIYLDLYWNIETLGDFVFWNNNRDIDSVRLNRFFWALNDLDPGETLTDYLERRGKFLLDSDEQAWVRNKVRRHYKMSDIVAPDIIVRDYPVGIYPIIDPKLTGKKFESYFEKHNIFESSELCLGGKPICTWELESSEEMKYYEVNLDIEANIKRQLDVIYSRTKIRPNHRIHIFIDDFILSNLNLKYGTGSRCNRYAELD
jgi:hypothetical protein